MRNRTNLLNDKEMRNSLMIFFIALCVIACEEKEISLYPSIEESVSIDIKTSSFEESATINGFDINESVNDVVEGDGKIERIIIEGIWFELTPKSTNTAKSIVLNFDIKSWANDSYLSILKNYQFDIKPGKVVFIKELQIDGANELRRQINAIVKGVSGGDMKFEVEGEVSPVQSVVDVELEVFISGTVIYKGTI